MNLRQPQDGETSDLASLLAWVQCGVLQNKVVVGKTAGCSEAAGSTTIEDSTADAWCSRVCSGGGRNQLMEIGAAEGAGEEAADGEGPGGDEEDDDYDDGDGDDDMIAGAAALAAALVVPRVRH